MTAAAWPARRLLAVGLGFLLAFVVLRVAGASRVQISAAAADPQAYVAAAGADELVLVLATALGWVLLGWVGLGALLVLGSAAPGMVGWVFYQLARLLLPATLRRLVSLALGVAMLTGTTVASAAPPNPPATITVMLDRPGPVEPTHGVPDWPPAPVADPEPADPSAPPPSSSSDQPAPVSRGEYTVQPGDCLWDIAERVLAQAGSPIDASSVAAALEAWWQVNRSQIDDPDVIFAGQILAVPTPLP